MTGDEKARQAREHHLAAAASEREADQHRESRNRLIRELRAEDPSTWTYPAIARVVGCTPELVAAIVKGRT